MGTPLRGLASPTRATPRYGRDALVQFAFHTRGFHGQAVEDAAGSRAGIEGDAEQHMLAMRNSQCPRPAARRRAPASVASPCPSPITRCSWPSVAITTRGEQPCGGVADLFAGHPQPVHNIGGKADVQKPEQQVLGSQHTVLLSCGCGRCLHTRRQPRHHRQNLGRGAAEVPAGRAQGEASPVGWHRRTAACVE
jgi:hypothetical protein